MLFLAAFKQSPVQPSASVNRRLLWLTAAYCERTMNTLYGISNCDTVKKARTWLDQAQVAYTFHDFRKDGLTREQVTAWVAALGWETLVNKRSTTWKGLDESTKAGLNNSTVIDIILDQPTLIKRPLLDRGGKLQVGFKDADYQYLFT